MLQVVKNANGIPLFINILAKVSERNTILKLHQILIPILNRNNIVKNLKDKLSPWKKRLL